MLDEGYSAINIHYLHGPPQSRVQLACCVSSFVIDSVSFGPGQRAGLRRSSLARHCTKWGAAVLWSRV